MQVRADEIAAVLERQLAGYEAEVDVAEVGTVLSVGDGIARVYGLEQAMAGELLAFPNDVYGLALNLEEDQVGAVLMGESRLVEEGDEVRRTGRVMEVPVGPALVGRVVGPLGNPIDGKGPIESAENYPIERIAPGVVDREPVSEPMQTGIKAIDSMIPIGRGQRELIIGDRQTGKTALIGRHLHQPEADRRRRSEQQGSGHLHLRRGRPEAVDGEGQVVQEARGERCAGPTRSSCRRSASSSRRSMQFLSCPTPAAAMGERLRCTNGLPRPRDRLRRPLRSRRLAYRQVIAAAASSARVVRPSRVTCSTCTRVCSSVRPSCPDAKGGGSIDGAAGRRDAGRRRVGLHPDQRDLDHRRPDLRRGRRCSTRASARP